MFCKIMEYMFGGFLIVFTGILMIALIVLIVGLIIDFIKNGT
nr:MAG TPA: Oxaloacetate decarboxylase, gamma chain [Caudoviricetes sp.]